VIRVRELTLDSVHAERPAASTARLVLGIAVMLFDFASARLRAKVV